MEVAFVADKFVSSRNGKNIFPFGSAIYLNDLAQELTRRGVRTTVIQRCWPGSHVGYIGDVRVISVPVRKGEKYADVWPHTVPHSATLIHLNNIDIASQRSFDIPITGTIHTNAFLLDDGARKFLLSNIAPRMSRIVVINSAYLDGFPEIAGKLVKIENFVDTGIFQFKKKTDGVLWPKAKLVFPSRQTEAKGVFFAIDLATVLKQLYAWQGYLILAGEPASNAVNYAEKQHAPCDFVGYLDHYRDMPSLYREGDLTVIPSKAEACGLVALESIACGSPIVATDIVGLNDVIKNSNAGISLPLNIEVWAREITRLLRSPSHYNLLQRNARAWTKKCHSVRIAADEYLAMWHTLLMRKVKMKAQE